MSRIRRTGLALSAATVLIALSGCSLVSAFTPHVESQIYDSTKEFKAAALSGIGSSDFVPDDATVIRLDYDTRTGAAIMTYASATLLKPSVCTGDTPTPKPSIEDSWWPAGGIPEKASVCPDGWRAFAVGTQVYATRAAAGK